ncbi:MAG: NAD(P)/FAD-dependent oxidoreductase, partial [Myxococcales bacterium]|nr:NAD(P)/FAD-dependent oxidoreductase [Myxococcales bacterium]
MNEVPKKVLIVGAGPSGLVALKEMLAQGLEATVLEKAPGFGGVFRDPNDAVYDDLYLTTSNVFMAFSDFPVLESGLRYSSKRAYAEYLRAYVEHFDLARHVRFETQVVRAHFDRELRRWQVDVVDGEGQHRLEVDQLIVATGSQHEPAIPTFEGWTGPVVHGSAYRGPQDFAGKRVLVVGVGESASDIAAEIAEVAAETVVWSRRPVIVAPRFPVAAMDPAYDEQEILRERPETLARLNDFLEILTITPMANRLSMMAYAVPRILIFAAIRHVPAVSAAAKRTERWNSVAIDR